MSRMITGEELREAVRAGTLIENGDLKSAEGVKYDFRLGPKILKAKFGQPVDMRTKDTADLVVEPGEVVFVLTEERMKLPLDTVAQLSPKRKLSHDGILCIGGLFIDPGYHGHLLIGLFNISSTRFPLILNKKLIGATFYKLEGDEVGEFPAPPPPVDDFPDDLVKVIREYQPIAIQKLAATLQGLEVQVSDIRRDMRDREDWAKRFQGYLEAHNEQIGRITDDLSKEIEARKAGQDDLKSTLTWLKGAAWTLTGVLSIALALFIAWLVGLLPTPVRKGAAAPSAEPTPIASPAPAAPLPMSAPAPGPATPSPRPQ